MERIPISREIDTARVVAITLVILIHLPPYNLYNYIRDTGAQPLSLLYLYMTELFARGAVPLLSVISGYLLHTRTARPHQALVAQKARTLMIPFLCWNCIGIAARLAAGGHGERESFGTMDIVNALLGLTSPPELFQLYFVRDIFVCILCYPLFLMAKEFLGLLLLPILGIAFVANLDGPLVLSPFIPIFFCAGIYIKEGRISLEVESTAMRVLVIVMALAVPAAFIVMNLVFADALRAVLGPFFDSVRNSVGLIQRIFTSYAFWMLTSYIVAAGMHRRVNKLSPYTFFLFCAHPLIIGAVWIVWRRLIGGVEHPFYPLFFLSMPVVCMAVSIIAVKAITKLTPWLLPLLTGGRTRQPPHPAS